MISCLMDRASDWPKCCNQRNAYREWGPCLPVGPASWTMGTEKLKLCTIGKKMFCTGPTGSAGQFFMLPHPSKIHRLNSVTTGSWPVIFWMQGWCVPDRCVPDQTFLDVAPLEQSIPWILCPWPMCPNPGPRQAWTAQRMGVTSSRVSTQGPHQECPAFGLYITYLT
jgi:hypothetical protein